MQYICPRGRTFLLYTKVNGVVWDNRLERKNVELSRKSSSLIKIRLNVFTEDPNRDVIRKSILKPHSVSNENLRFRNFNNEKLFLCMKKLEKNKPKSGTKSKFSSTIDLITKMKNKKQKKVFLFEKVQRLKWYEIYLAIDCFPQWKCLLQKVFRLLWMEFKRTREIERKNWPRERICKNLYGFLS